MPNRQLFPGTAEVTAPSRHQCQDHAGGVSHPSGV